MRKKQYLILIFFSVVLISSCKKADERYIALENYLLESEIYINNYSTIFVVTENGCSGCNKYFSEKVESYISDDNTFVLLNADGAGVDISYYLDKENIHFVEKYQKEINFLNESGIIILNNQERKIDTIITIDYTNAYSSDSIIQAFHVNPN